VAELTSDRVASYTTLRDSTHRRGDRWAWWTLLIGNTIAFVSAMTYDLIVGAIGPFELTEYLALAAIYGPLAITAPFARPRKLTGHSLDVVIDGLGRSRFGSPSRRRSLAVAASRCTKGRDRCS
jgi:hypothetical protein